MPDPQIFRTQPKDRAGVVLGSRNGWCLAAKVVGRAVAINSNINNNNGAVMIKRLVN